MDKFDGVLDEERVNFCLHFFQSFHNLRVKNDNLGRFWTRRSKRIWDGRLWGLDQSGWSKSAPWNEFREESDEVSNVRIFKMCSFDTSEHQKPWKKHPIFHERMFSHSSVMSEREYNSKLFSPKLLLDAIVQLGRRSRWDRIYNCSISNSNVKNVDLNGLFVNQEFVDGYKLGKENFSLEFMDCRQYEARKLENYEFSNRSMHPMFQVVFGLTKKTGVCAEENETKLPPIGYLILESTLHWKYLEKSQNDSFLFFGYLITSNEIKYIETSGCVFDSMEYDQYDRFDDDRGLFLNRLLVETSRRMQTKETKKAIQRYIRCECYETAIKTNFEVRPNAMGMYLPPLRALNMMTREGVKHPNVKNIRLQPNKFCRHCGAVNVPLKKCSICRMMNYCSRKCQTEDWKRYHKQVCHTRKSTIDRLENNNSNSRVHAQLLPRLAEYAQKNPMVTEYPDFLFRTQEERDAKQFFDFSLKMKELDRHPQKAEIAASLLDVLERKKREQR